MARATEWKESVLSDMRAGEASDIVVFLSSSHFTTFVKRMTGYTPSQIRQGGLDG